MAHQSYQVFYVKILCLNIGLLFFIKNKIEVNEENLNILNIVDTRLLKTMINFDEDPLVDDVHETHKDHNERI